MVARTTFPAMGSTVRVVVHGLPALAVQARRRVDDLEAKWSRFQPMSELSRLNRSPGPRAVSADTRLLLRRCVDAWTLTAGAFDPTVHDALVRWGYDRDLAAVGTASPSPGGGSAPGLGSVVIDDDAGTVDLGGVRVDPGGIGKGLAADLVATELADLGADSALVAVGGDLRIAGDPAARWTVGIEDPRRPGTDLATIDLYGGGLATSSPRRRWSTTAGEVHHLFDPRTGAPADVRLAGVTVLAGSAWWAEALTKAVLVGGVPADRLDRWAASGLGVNATGSLVGTADLLDVLREAAA